MTIGSGFLKLQKIKKRTNFWRHGIAEINNFDIVVERFMFKQLRWTIYSAYAVVSWNISQDLICQITDLLHLQGNSGLQALINGNSKFQDFLAPAGTLICGTGTSKCFNISSFVPLWLLSLLFLSFCCAFVSTFHQVLKLASSFCSFPKQTTTAASRAVNRHYRAILLCKPTKLQHYAIIQT